MQLCKLFLFFFGVFFVKHFSFQAIIEQSCSLDRESVINPSASHAQINDYHIYNHGHDETENRQTCQQLDYVFTKAYADLYVRKSLLRGFIEVTEQPTILSFYQFVVSSLLDFCYCVYFFLLLCFRRLTLMHVLELFSGSLLCVMFNFSIGLLSTTLANKCTNLRVQTKEKIENELRFSPENYLQFLSNAVFQFKKQDIAVVSFAVICDSKHYVQMVQRNADYVRRKHQKKETRFHTGLTRLRSIGNIAARNDDGKDLNSWDRS